MLRKQIDATGFHFNYTHTYHIQSTGGLGTVHTSNKRCAKETESTKTSLIKISRFEEFINRTISIGITTAIAAVVGSALNGETDATIAMRLIILYQ